QPGQSSAPALVAIIDRSRNGTARLMQRPVSRVAEGARVTVLFSESTRHAGAFGYPLNGGAADRQSFASETRMISSSFRAKTLRSANAGCDQMTRRPFGPAIVLVGRRMLARLISS